jgi:hypothetical protein
MKIYVVWEIPRGGDYEEFRGEFSNRINAINFASNLSGKIRIAVIDMAIPPRFDRSLLR